MGLPLVLGAGALAGRAIATTSLGTRIVGLSNKALAFLGFGAVATPIAISALDPIDTLGEETIMGVEKNKLPIIAGIGILAFMALKK